MKEMEQTIFCEKISNIVDRKLFDDFSDIYDKNGKLTKKALKIIKNAELYEKDGIPVEIDSNNKKLSSIVEMIKNMDEAKVNVIFQKAEDESNENEKKLEDSTLVEEFKSKIKKIIKDIQDEKRSGT